MNAQTILDAISNEKNKFLEKYDDHAYFNKETSWITQNLNRAPPNLDLSMTLIVVLVSFIGLPLAVSSSVITYDFFLHLFGITSSGAQFSFSILSLIFCFTSLVYAPLKIAFRKLLNAKYKNRKNNNVISDLFSSDFYKIIISDEIQNMLKVFLPDNTYVELRKGNKEITYGKARLALLDIIERDSLLDEKREIFLTPDEIKQYSYAK